MPVTNLGMVQARDDGEVLAMLLEALKIGSSGVSRAGFFWKQVRRVKAEVIKNADEAHRRLGVGGKSWQHRIETWEAQSDPRAS